MSCSRTAGSRHPKPSRRPEAGRRRTRTPPRRHQPATARATRTTTSRRPCPGGYTSRIAQGDSAAKGTPGIRIPSRIRGLSRVMVGATGFEPATTCTPTGAGTIAPGLMEADGTQPRGFPGIAAQPTSHVGAADAVLRMACTAPALRKSGLPAPEPALFLTAGGTVARLWPTQEAVILARAALQAALADAALLA